MAGPGRRGPGPGPLPGPGPDPGGRGVEWVAWECRKARQHGVHILPIQPGDLDPAQDFAALPQAIKARHIYNDTRERERLVLHIKSRPERPERVPFLAPAPPETYVQRTKEYMQLRTLLLDERRENPVAITTALQAPGGSARPRWPRPCATMTISSTPSPTASSGSSWASSARRPRGPDVALSGPDRRAAQLHPRRASGAAARRAAGGQDRPDRHRRRLATVRPRTVPPRRQGLRPAVHDPAPRSRSGP